MRLNDISISRNFRLYEFESPDTHQVKLQPELIIRLQQLRDRVGQPLSINSAYRTPEHNDKVEGSPKSQHMEGAAVDIALPLGLTIDELANMAEAIGFDGIGKYDKFVHVDVRGYKARWDKRTRKG